MEPMGSLKKHKESEADIQEAIIRELRYREWLVKPTHGSMFQAGFPDLYCRHKTYGERWVEVKHPEKHVFTPAQCEWFPIFEAHGAAIWILVGASDSEIDKLRKPHNWREYFLKQQLRMK